MDYNKDKTVDDAYEKKSIKDHQIKEVLHICKLTSNLVVKFAQEVQFYQDRISESKTAPKKRLYVKKRNKVKNEFINVVAKRQALIELLNSLGVDEHGHPIRKKGDTE